jgi:tetratricopeptide (TPR) repeat protein
MAPGNPTISTLLLGSLGLLSFSMLMYFTFFRKQPKFIKFDDSAEGGSGKVAPDGKLASTETATATGSTHETDVTVEDVGEDEEEDDEEESGAVDVELEALKTRYEDSNRLASKFISGQKYDKAIEKLSEAIELAPQVPNAGKDIMTLYNNRSAMYEKSEVLDKALTDITVVLSMDGFHLKARVRRARIYEQQGKQKLALEEYILATLLQTRKGEPTSHQLKIDSLVKTMSLKSSPALFKKMRQEGTHRVLPSKSHCRNFLESYPSMQMWREQYLSMEREGLASAMQSAMEVQAEEAIQENGQEAADFGVLKSTLEVVCWDLIHNDFETAFKTLNTLPLPADCTNSPEAPALLEAVEAGQELQYVVPFELGCPPSVASLHSLQFELVGFERHLRCQLTEAIAGYAQALRYLPCNVDARLKLANVYLEQGDVPESMDMYKTTLQAFVATKAALAREEEGTEGTEAEAEGAEAPPGVSGKEMLAIMKAWTLLHRVSVFVTRNDLGEYPPNAINDAMADVDAAIALTTPLRAVSVAGRAAAVTALIRTVHILAQSKPMVGETPTDADTQRTKDCIIEAKELHPGSESVLMMEAEILNNEGDTEAALKILDGSSSRPDAIPDDCTPYFVKASILITKAMSIFTANPGMEELQVAKGMLQEADELYIKALTLEPHAVEVINCYAQYCSMMGEVSKAVDLLRQAVPLARTRDDVQDLNQLLILNEAQLKASNFIADPTAA